MKILLIIPAYNEENNIKNLVNKIYSICGEAVDILVINDCSVDETKSICEKMGVLTINLPCNLGIGGAVQTGYKYAAQHGYDIAIQVDGDGQHKPEYIMALVSTIIEDNADMIIGSRFINKEGFQSTLMRRAGIAYFTYLLKILSKEKITDPTSGFRACNRKVIGTFAKRYPVDYPEPESIMYLLRNGYRIKEVPVIMQERMGGRSSITTLKSIYYMIKVSLAILIDRFRKQIV
ncbi:putative glycosyl transferase [Paenibacillus dendritiformis]|uniref:glycosyltransferase family 2 protein n=1 Tax=Paenibacillus dendritiformis TaxID=130049 RepID=UPI001B06B767|nr:glycosyltransferase family 2 protein [Paenibacillus dendritiformis]GIO75388.1 putative glycosyl transferase [Paenibacillus dendritiformis]